MRVAPVVDKSCPWIYWEKKWNGDLCLIGVRSTITSYAGIVYSYANLAHSLLLVPLQDWGHGLRRICIHWCSILRVNILNRCDCSWSQNLSNDKKIMQIQVVEAYAHATSWCICALGDRWHVLLKVCHSMNRTHRLEILLETSPGFLYLANT